MIQGLAFRLKDLVCKETGVPCWWRSERLKIEYLSQQSKKTFKKFNNQLSDLHANMNCVDVWSGAFGLRNSSWSFMLAK